MPIELKFDFKTDYTNILFKCLTDIGFNDLNLDLLNLLISWFNYQFRLITPIPRKIFKSEEYYETCKTCSDKVKEGILLLENKIINGEDIRPHLSRRILESDYNDAQLNDWGITHLHLGTQIQSNALINPTSELLYARFIKENAYFIIIGKHGQWSDLELIKTVHKWWPETLMELNTNDEIVDGEKPITNKYIEKMRKNRIGTILEIEGKKYSQIGGGYTLSGKDGKYGVSQLVLMRVMEVIWNLEEYERIVNNEIKQIIIENYIKEKNESNQTILVNLHVNKFGFAFAVIPSLNIEFELGNL